MNTSNMIHSLTKDVSVTIHKGNYDITIGKAKETAPTMTTQQVTQPTPRPVQRTPIAFQDVAFVFVLIALVAVAWYYGLKRKVKSQTNVTGGWWWWK